MSQFEVQYMTVGAAQAQTVTVDGDHYDVHSTPSSGLVADVYLTSDAERPCATFANVLSVQTVAPAAPAA